MLDLIWNLFQDDDVARIRAEVANRNTRSEPSHGESAALEARLLELERRHEQLNRPRSRFGDCSFPLQPFGQFSRL